MRVLLMYRDRDFDLRADPPPRADDLIQDLELETLFGAMAGGDPFLLDVARRGVLAGLDDPGAILYRQAVLRDCLEQPAVVRDIYQIALEAIEGEKKDYFFGVFTSRSPELVLHRSVRILELFVGLLKRLRAIADASGGGFRSEGFVRFLTMLGE